VHSSTGIVVEARAYYRAALQALALQLVDRQRSGSYP